MPDHEVIMLQSNQRPVLLDNVLHELWTGKQSPKRPPNYTE